MGVLMSTGSAGDCYDNAMAESFFATLECELINRHAFQTQAEARMAIFEYLESWYNTRRRHSALGYLSPNDFERTAAAPGVHREGSGAPHHREDLEVFSIDEPKIHNNPHPVRSPSRKATRWDRKRLLNRFESGTKRRAGRQISAERLRCSSNMSFVRNQDNP